MLGPEGRRRLSAASAAPVVLCLLAWPAVSSARAPEPAQPGDAGVGDASAEAPASDAPSAAPGAEAIPLQLDGRDRAAEGSLAVRRAPRPFVPGLPAVPKKEPAPVYTRWWFWILAAAIAGGAAAVGVAVAQPSPIPIHPCPTDVTKCFGDGR